MTRGSTARIGVTRDEKETSMNPEVLFKPGPVRVFDKDGQPVGFAWVENTTNLSGQVQRWLLKHLMRPYDLLSLVLEEWTTGAPQDLAEWTARATLAHPYETPYDGSDA